MTKEWQEYRDTQNKKHAEERAQYNATVREDPSKYVGDNVTQEWQEYRDEQNRKHVEERARTVREDPSKYVGDNVTKEWQEYRDAQNKKHAEERARTVRDDPGRYTDPNNPDRGFATNLRDDAGRYTDPNNKDGWYAGDTMVDYDPHAVPGKDVEESAYWQKVYGSRDKVRQLQEHLGVPKTGIWDKATNNAYQRYLAGNPERTHDVTGRGDIYADPNNRNGWYAGGMPVAPGDTNAIKATQKMLGIPQTGVWDRKTNNAYQRWKGKQGGAFGGGTGYNGDRDSRNRFSAGGIGGLFGMKYDKRAGMYYHSNKLGPQHYFGFHELYDFAGSTIFHLKSAKTDFTYNGQRMSHRIWMGDYFAPLRSGTLADSTGWNKPGVYGGESSLFVSEQGGFDEYAPKDQFIQQVTVKDGNGKTIVNFDSTQMYADKKTDWVFAAKGGTNKPATIEGTITYQDVNLLRALVTSGANSAITYGQVRANNDGTWSVDWRAKAA